MYFLTIALAALLSLFLTMPVFAVHIIGNSEMNLAVAKQRVILIMCHFWFYGGSMQISNAEIGKSVENYRTKNTLIYVQ